MAEFSFNWPTIDILIIICNNIAEIRTLKIKLIIDY